MLATDLDGTLIPLDGCASNVPDLATLAEQVCASDVTLVFVTGRHFDSVAAAINEHCLPQPDWIICDVGTTIYQRQVNDDFVRLPAYGQHLADLTVEVSRHELRSRLAGIDHLSEQVRDSHQQAGCRDRLFAAQEHTTSGVLDGCRMFGLIDDEPHLR